MPKYKYQRDEILERPEVEQMIKAARAPWLKTLTAFLYLYGCRISEALQVKKKDLWTDETYLFARLGMKKQRTQMGPFNEVPHILKVPLAHPFTQGILNYWHKLDPNQYLWMMKSSPERSRTHVNYEMKKINRKCSPHLFRHSRLMKLALTGADAWALQDWAAWSDIRPASHYIRAAGTLAATLSDKVID